VFAKFPKLIRDRCRKCGFCADKCRSNAIFQAPGQFPVFVRSVCSGCGLCWNLCPNGAVEVEEEVIGEVYENEIDKNFYLVTGRSVGVVEETSPVVTTARDYAFRLAEKVSADYVLVDTSVGMHCGVIRALLNVDLAYAVTEPTPLGVHDLDLIIKLLKIVNVPTKVVINQADMGDKSLVTEIAEKEGVLVEYEIGFSREVLEAYSEGNMGELNIL
jgi:MinD superfamily P-loop ATPase